MVSASFLEEVARRGWTYVENPTIDAVHGLNCPPFGQGFRRVVHDQIVGNSGLGVPFQAIRYSSDMPGSDSGFSRTVSLRLSHAMPPLFISLPDHPRPGIVGLTIPNRVGLLTVSPDPQFGDAVLELVQPALVRWAKQYPISLSIDGDSLVGTGAPVAPDQLATYVEALDDIAAAIGTAPSLGRFRSVKPEGLSFYQRPSWTYRTRDDSLLLGGQLTRAGRNHRAEDVVDIPERGLWYTGFTHRYETDSTDSNGHSSTTHHADPVGRMFLPFRFGVLANRWRGYGDPLFFFGGSMSDYAFSSPDPGFATAVVESLRDFLDTAALPPFLIAGDQVHVRAKAATVQEIDRLSWLFPELFSLVPDPIWNRLGLPTSPVPRSLR